MLGTTVVLGTTGVVPLATVLPAAASDPGGRVSAQVGLKVHSSPSLSARVTRTLAYHQVVTLSCKVTGQSVEGNRVWYNLAHGGWVSARYVDRLSATVPSCQPGGGSGGARAQGRVTSRTDLHVRKGASTSSALVKDLKPGSVVPLYCKKNGQKIGGNSLWYMLGDGSGWVSARYADNLEPTQAGPRRPRRDPPPVPAPPSTSPTPNASHHRPRKRCPTCAARVRSPCPPTRRKTGVWPSTARTSTTSTRPD